MIIIKPYENNQREEVIEFILDIQRNEYQIPITRADQPDLLEVDRFYRKGNGNFWVACSEDVVVGSIGLLDIGSAEGALRKMFVKKEYRGKHIGASKALLDTLLAWARDTKFERIYLGTTDKFEAAHKFYERNKFRNVEKESLPLAFPLMTVDSRFYLYDLVDG